MWQCPACGREFKNAGQQHFCSEPLKEIDDYIARQPEAVQPLLRQVRSALRDALPEAEERISWRMPTYWQKRNIIHFAAFQKHLGIYPGSEAIVHFADRLSPFKTSKGAIQLPYDQPLPLELITQIAQWCCQAGSHP